MQASETLSASAKNLGGCSITCNGIPLKPLRVRFIIRTRVSSFKIVSGDAVHQPTWLLKIEHMVKLQVLGNNSKNVNDIKNVTWGKNDQHSKIYLPCNFEVNLFTHLGVIALFS